MKTITLIAALVLSATLAQGQNLLLNGNFNSPASAASPDNWTTWGYGGGYANHEVLSPAPSVLGIYDGSYQMTCGAASTSGGGGVYQNVSAAAGTSYRLSVDGGAQNWWLPSGEIRLFFLDAGNNQLSLTQIKTTDGIHNPDAYDVGVAYQGWSFSALAPLGTTQAKVEFAGFGGGSVWFDNASLTVVPEPSALALGGVAAAFLLRRRLRSDTK